MPTTAKPSASDSHHATSTPATEPAVSTPSPLQAIFDDYYRKARSDPRLLEAILKPRYTTKASILFDALTKDLLTDIQYREHTFETLVKFTKRSETMFGEYGRYDICTIPVFVCVDEGSHEEFKRDMARISKEDTEFKKFNRLVVGWVDPKDPWVGREPYFFDTDAAGKIKLLKARESNYPLTADWYPENQGRSHMVTPEFMARWEEIGVSGRH